MNPEFVRNMWLEATLFRLALIAGLLLLAFAAASTIGANLKTVALGLYWFFAVLWGTRSAGLSVVGEIRERTWDSQKLSAIGPLEMVWGKLFGATIQNWFGAAICLLTTVLFAAREQGIALALRYCVVLLLTGILAQAVALLSSLMLIRRNTGNWRLDTFLCQIAGIVAAAVYYSLGHSAGALARAQFRGLTWWGHDFDHDTFQSVSLTLAVCWALVGCWRAMRAELRLTNGPFVWLAWLAYLAIYQAGFASLLPQRFFDTSGLPLNLTYLSAGAGALLASTYGMVFLERKDPVRLRWLGEQVKGGHVGRAFLALDAWMLSYVVTLIAGLVLAAWLAAIQSPFAPAVVAILGFMTRDAAIFLLLRGFSGGKGDFAALAVLAALYILLPRIVGPMSPVAGLLLPLPGNPLAPVAAWTQGIGVTLWAWRSLQGNSLNKV